jgi:DNA-binding transcriptional regulator YiaG
MTGAELKKLRNRLGLSVTAASRQINVSARSWQRWQSGRQKIPAGALELFCLKNKLKYPPE